ncbi:MAG: hypothetical protein LBR88_03905 [Zoogloeaceae bacterium]|jgi:uncharacterized protein|nr:hypothetical protein [Zoogloeaceae bacterium]
MKFLFWFLVVWLVWRWWRSVRRLGARRAAARDAQASGGVAPDWMVPCAHCGLHVPQAEMLMDDAGLAYCSEAHRRLGVRHG